MIHLITIGNKKVWEDITLSFSDALNEADKECKLFYYENNFRQRDIEFGKFNIIVHGNRVIPPKDSFNILFQTEQHTIRKRGWDIVLESFPKFVRKENHFYFPMGYSKHFDTDIKTEEVRDFFFFGAIAKSKRRREFFKKHGVYAIRNGIWGLERDKLIMSTRFNLSIHPWQDSYMFPSLRSLLVMCKGKIFLQEECSGGYGPYKDYVIDFTMDNFEKVIEEWRNDKKRKEYGQYVREELMNKNRFDDNLFKLIGKAL